ncbi:transposase IS66, partial [mine drainage metagenome]
QVGGMGIYLLNYITMLKYNLRGPMRRVQEFLLNNNELDLSVKGINNALLRVGDACRNEYNAMRNRIRRSKWVHIDETGFHVNGKKYWLWAFRSAENDILIVNSGFKGQECCQGCNGRSFPW